MRIGLAAQKLRFIETANQQCGPVPSFYLVAEMEFELTTSKSDKASVKTAGKNLLVPPITFWRGKVYKYPKRTTRATGISDKHKHYIWFSLWAWYTVSVIIARRTAIAKWYGSIWASNYPAVDRDCPFIWWQRNRSGPHTLSQIISCKVKMTLVPSVLTYAGENKEAVSGGNNKL